MIIKNFVMIAFAVFMILNIAGCGNSQNTKTIEPINVAFVVGIADGEAKFNDNIAEFYTLPDSPGTNYAFISAEGEPTVIGETGCIPDLSDRGYTDVMMKRIRGGIRSELANRLAAYVPSSAQIDVAGATELAVRNLSAKVVEGRSNVLVYHMSGRSTSGAINMLETPLYKLDVDSSVDMVSRNMTIDMSSIDKVVFYCCGDVGKGSRQQKIVGDDKKKLQEFYEKLFKALGAKSVEFKKDLPRNEGYHFDSSPVSCIEVSGISSKLKPVDLDEKLFRNADASIFSEPIAIPEDMVCFKPDSDHYLDPKAAAKAIKPIADCLKKNSGVSILLYGTCAGDADNEYTLSLGKARALSVKKSLIAEGIDGSRIKVVKIKSVNDPYYQHGLGKGAKASVNRKCIIIDINSDVARKILANAC